MSIIIGFDFGVKRIGVAIGETLLQSANPETTIIRKNKKYDWACIDSLMQKYQPKAIVVGWPLTEDGQMQEITLLVDKFIRRLEPIYSRPVYKIDERYTSAMAKQTMRENNHSLWDKEQIDQLAACEILASWMREQNDTN